MKEVHVNLEVTYTVGGVIEVEDSDAALLEEYEGKTIDPAMCSDEEFKVYEVIDGCFSERDAMEWEVEIFGVTVNNNKNRKRHGRIIEKRQEVSSKV